MHPFVFLAISIAINHAGCDVIAPYCLSSGQKIQHKTNGLTISGVLPKTLGVSVVCQFTTERISSQFLSIKAQTKQTNGSLRVEVYDSNLIGGSIGILELNKGTIGTTKVCLKNNSRRKYAAIISGTPSVNYTVTIVFASHHLELNKAKTFSGPKMFFFLPNQSKDAQLDVTVKSKDNSKAILRVSRFCDQVENVGVINRQKPTISLTFAKQGRITISRVSNPPLSQSEPMFIGVRPEAAQSNDSSFTINITNSFDYDYRVPICFIVFVPLFGGILVALWALYCFREPLDLGPGVASSASLGESNTSSIKVSKASSMACWSGHQANELTPLIRQPYVSLSSTNKEILKAMLKVLKYHWVGNGSRAFSYITCVVGFVLFVGAFQYVDETWNTMVDEGLRDKCFYDDLCYRVSPYSDIPFNLMISNMAYVIHGMILAVAVWVMEAELYVHAKKKSLLYNGNSEASDNNREALPHHTLICSNIAQHLPELSVPKCQIEQNSLVELFAHAYKRKYSFSVGYAFAWALIFEGFFSLTYHLCPSRLSFQFDTAFMFVIAGLIVVSLFNGLAVRECDEQDGKPRPIEDSVFYLFVIVPLYILNYLGSVFNTKDRQSTLANAIFLVLIVCWYLAMFSWSGFKLFYVDIIQRFHKCESKIKLFWFCVTVICTCIVFPCLFSKDFSHMFLFSCITIAVMSTIGKITINAVKAPPAKYSTFKAMVFKIIQFSYVVFALGIMIGAIYIFDGIPTTEKTDSPEKSRDLNKECALLGFYDYHDIWHMMSSFALLMGSFLVMYISE